MSVKRILEKYKEQRNTLPVAIGAALKSNDMVRQKVTRRNELGGSDLTSL